MPVDGLDGPKLGIGNEAPLGLTISWREEHIGRHRHDKSPGFNSSQCGAEVTASVAADVAALPFPYHTQQIVRIHNAEITVHEVDDKIVHRRKAQCFMPILLEELSAPAHNGPHFGVTKQALSHVCR